MDIGFIKYFNLVIIILAFLAWTFYSVIKSYWSISDSIVKDYSGDDTWKEISWENNTMSNPFLIINLPLIWYRMLL